MKVVGIRTTRKDNKKSQTTNIIYDQNSMSIMENNNKIKLASDKNQRRLFNLYFIREDMGPVLNATG